MFIHNKFRRISSLFMIILLVASPFQTGGQIKKAKAADQINLALNAAAINASSSMTGSNRLANIVDGNTATLWQPNSTDRPNGFVWFILDLGSFKTFNKAVLQFGTNVGSDKVKIEYNNDNGSTWNAAYEKSIENKASNSPRTETAAFGQQVEGRYVKVTFTLVDTVKNFNLSEFELYNDVPAKTAPVTNAFVVNGNGQGIIHWQDPVQDTNYLDFDQVIVTDISDSSNPNPGTKIVDKGVGEVTIDGLTNGKEYTFAVKTAAKDRTESDAVNLSMVPTEKQNTILINFQQLTKVKESLTSTGKEYADAVNKLIGEADAALTKGPYSVTYKPNPAPNASIHDYWSIGPYWWPDPTKPDGMPYINKDGQFNPEGYTEKYDKQSFMDLRDAVSSLSLAYYLTNKEEYAKHAALLLKTWFINPETKMNPNMRYAQGVPGVTDGRKEGVLESDKLLDIIDDIELISPSNSWTTNDTIGFKTWLSEYTNWLETNSVAQDEKNTANNHGTWFDAQFTAYNLYLGAKNKAKNYLQKTTIPRMTDQIMDDGTMPEELRRTRPFHYFTFNLIPFTMLAVMGDQVGVDVWSAGEEIRKAYDFITPYVVDFTGWPYDELEAQEDERIFSTYLREAAAKFGEDSYWSASDIMLKDQLTTHRANLVAPSLAGGSPRKEFVTFSFKELYTPVVGTIYGNEINVTVPKGTERKGLVASFITTGKRVKVGKTVQVSGETANDFTDPVKYTVESPNGSIKTYMVKVTESNKKFSVKIYQSSFTEFRADPRIDEILSQDSSVSLFDIMEKFPQSAADIKPLIWYQGYYDQGHFKAPAQIFVKDGNSTHTRSMPAALRLLKDSANSSTATVNVSTKGYKDLTISFNARTQNKTNGYKLVGEWSVDNGNTWNTSGELLRDSSHTELTDTYAKIPFTFTISNPNAFDKPNFLFRFRLDSSSIGYMNLDDVEISAVPSETNADLSRLILSEGTLSPSFNADVTEYTVNLKRNINRINITPVTADAAARVKVNGVAGSELRPILLKIGDNPIHIEVTPKKGEPKTYHINVKRVDFPGGKDK
ncbi:alginate lyase family protein [Bacillus sp. OK048]|uniref:alginate lyase family protein n=1 Tax=Bacillus sp. OK048 TaxID=1882761 RepID=UPI000885CA6A|nr:alginate lyase family protein [Bacillus sp. OK048]SDL94739.1 Cadherin-like beta sandwich domain-containing protein [Bacillus sp. OK048]